MFCLLSGAERLKPARRLVVLAPSPKCVTNNIALAVLAPSPNCVANNIALAFVR